MVYGSEEGLYIKAIDEFEGRPIPGTEGALGPFFSPDGTWLGFTQRGTLKRLSFSGETIDGAASIDVARKACCAQSVEPAAAALSMIVIDMPVSPVWLLINSIWPVVALKLAVDSV